MIVTCTGCNTSFNLDDERVKKTGSKVRCSKCKSVFKVYPPVPLDEQDLAENIEEQKIEVPRKNTEGLSLSESEDLNFSKDAEDLEEEPKAEVETEAIAQSSKEGLPEEELDFSDLSESLEMGELAPADGLKDDVGKEFELIDPGEEIDFSELEKMLENGEISFDNLISEENKDKLKFADTEEIDLSEIDAAIDNFEDTDAEDTEEDTRELQLEFENDPDFQVLKNKNAEELDYSDLETIPGFNKISSTPENKDKADDIPSDLVLEMESDSVDRKSEEDSGELDFSDLETMLDSDTGAEESLVNPAEETAELSLELNRPSDSSPDLKFEDTIAFEEQELDFSDLEKMLETDTSTDDQAKELSMENLELSLETDAPPKTQQTDYLSDTISLDETQLDLKTDEDVHTHAAEHDENKFRDTATIGAENLNIAAVQQAQSDKEESVKVMPPPPPGKKFFGRFSLIFAIIVFLLLGAGAFIYYNPFGFEIPFVSDYIQSKVDKSGNLKITPVLYALKGDFVDTKAGTLFIITGKVRNDYKQPRSNIKVKGKVFKKGRTLFGTESVYCGNVISEQDLLEVGPAELKKRLQNRLGDNNLNVNVKPGSLIPFMIIFENPSPDLDEFIVEAESSIKG
ncbi:MAG: zinc-ribbon domain-containing protein [Desulfobacterales bacterium]